MKKIDDGNQLRAFLSLLTTAQQAQYAAACGTTVGYLRKHLCKNTRMDVTLVAKLVAKSDGKVDFATLRNDVDWSELRRLLARTQTRKS